MHILLTDALTCPRCGPAFGLILIADEMRDRRVLRGGLGCPNCRESYPVAGGVADLRVRGEEGIEPEVEPPGEGAESTNGGGDAGVSGAGGAADSMESGYRVAALLGVGDLPSTVLVAGYPRSVSSAVAGLLPESQVAASIGDDEAPATGASWIRHGVRLPFRTGSLKGVAIAGNSAGELLAESTRALAPGGRIVMENAPVGAVDRLAALGLELLLEQDGVVVASLSRPG
jgi:uncharacterized protein YbaR (Trm112 family)